MKCHEPPVKHNLLVHQGKPVTAFVLSISELTLVYSTLRITAALLREVATFEAREGSA